MVPRTLSASSQKQKGVVVLVSGWAGSGKDTVANYLVEHYGFHRLAFADVLKDVVSKQYSLPREWFDSRSRKEAPLLDLPLESRPNDAFSQNIVQAVFRECRNIHGDTPMEWDPLKQCGRFYSQDLSTFSWQKLYWTPRALLILEGNTKRCVDPGFWAVQLLSKIGESTSETKRFVISDWRFKNELECLSHRLTSTLFDLVPIRVNRFTSTFSKDVSEHDLDSFPHFAYMLNNSQEEGVSLPQLFQQVTHMAEEREWNVVTRQWNVVTRQWNVVPSSSWSLLPIPWKRPLLSFAGVAFDFLLFYGILAGSAYLLWRKRQPTSPPPPPRQMNYYPIHP